uniref:Amino acid permease/ SLC12A domain-containing protein n=1 Tax=Oryza barthii TaxID=65489 RepID=A0A0D3FJ22_9ORYZ
MAELGLLPSVFARRGPGRSATPWVAVAASAAVSVAVSFLGFDDVVATANLLYSLGTLLEFAAFLRLRAREESPSSLKRPYRVPLPLPALAAMCLVPSAFLAYVIAVAGWRVSAIAAGLTALGVGWHGVMRVCRSKKWLGFNTVVAAGPHLQLQDDPPAADRVVSQCYIEHVFKYKVNHCQFKSMQGLSLITMYIYKRHVEERSVNTTTEKTFGASWEAAIGVGFSNLHLEGGTIESPQRCRYL